MVQTFAVTEICYKFMHIRIMEYDPLIVHIPLNSKIHVPVAVLAQSVERVDCRAGGRGFVSRGRTNNSGS